MHFSSLSLIEYDYVLSFEADILFLDNPDFYFENYKKIKPNHNFYFERRGDEYKCKQNKIFIENTTFCFLCKPDLEIYEKITKYSKLSAVHSDHDILRIFYFNHNEYSNEKNLRYLHFVG